MADKQLPLIGIDKRYNIDIPGVGSYSAQDIIQAAKAMSSSGKKSKPAEPEDWNAFDKGFEEGYAFAKMDPAILPGTLLASGMSAAALQEENERLKRDLEHMRNKALKWELESNKWQEQMTQFRENRKAGK